MTPPDGTIRYAMEVVAFHQAIREAWCLATSADPAAWRLDNPAWGQCAVTALLVQDVQGGDLLRSTVRGVSHYWNRLPDGTILDLTLEQFGGDLPDAEPIVRDREYVLSFPETVTRYELLRERVGA